MGLDMDGWPINKSKRKKKEKKKKPESIEHTASASQS
jgi:hypothetical protein